MGDRPCDPQGYGLGDRDARRRRRSGADWYLSLRMARPNARAMAPRRAISQGL